MIATFISGGLVALINLITVIYTTKQTRRNLSNKALMMLMYDRITHLANKSLTKGEITHEELRVLIEMHTIYHDLGGNGYLDALMSDIGHLPINN